MISFTVPGEPVSLNVSFNQHWAVRSRHNKAMYDTVFALAYQAGWRKSMPKFTKVVITIIGGKLDHDNAIGGCKPIVDGLWRNDIIPGDNPKECKITYAFKKGKQKQVMVELDSILKGGRK
jgi:hypothetical protein